LFPHAGGTRLRSPPAPRACRLGGGDRTAKAGTHYFGIPLWYGLLFPADYTAGATMAIDSLRLRLSGRVTWKGRTYP
jgi:hypothetical protein